jgi:hypothetical protein
MTRPDIEAPTGEAAVGIEVAPPADTPSEEEIVALMATVMPSPAPTVAEFVAWRRLPREEQLRRIRQSVGHTGADAVCSKERGG